MPYIGKQLVRGQNRKLDDISSGFNGSQTTFTLQVASQNVTVGSALQLWISVGGVIQNPLTDFTIAGNQITFTTAPAASLDFFGVIQGDVTDTNTPGDATVTTSKLSTGLTVNLADGSAATSSLQLGGTDSGLFSSAADKVNVTTGGVERLEIGDSEVVFNDPSNDVDFRVESNGSAAMLFVDGGNDRVGIGTSSPTSLLEIKGGAATTTITSSTNTANLDITNSTQTTRLGATNNDFAITHNGSERLRIDSSGRLLVGTTSSVSSGGGDLLEVASGVGNILITSTNSTRAVDQACGQLRFWGKAGANEELAKIAAVADGTHGSGDKPTRLVFSTTADNANSPTERMRIDSSGRVGIGTTPSTKLHIASTAAQGDVFVTNVSGQNCLLEMAGNGNTIGSGNALYGQDASNNVYAGWARGAHPVRFGTSNAERMRIDSSGNIGIGESSPNTKLVVKDDSNALNDSVGNINVISTDSAAIDKGGSIGLGGFYNGTSNSIPFANIHGKKENSTNNNAAGYFAIATRDASAGTAERMRISSDGKCAFGSTSTQRTQANRSVIFTIATNGDISVNHSTTNSSGDVYLTFGYNGTAIGSVTQNGTTAVAYNTSSDYRLKENVVDLDGAITRVKQLAPKRFNFIADDSRIVDGFLAHEAQAVVPEAVTGTHNGVQIWKEGEELPDGVSVGDNKLDDSGNTIPDYQGIDQSKLVPLLTAALQEAIAKIETLETKVAALEAE